MSTLWRFMSDPIRGVTPLWKVAVLYSIVGGALLSVAAQTVGLRDPGAPRVFGLVALGYGLYVTFAVFRCAGNGPPRELALIIRIAAGISLLVLPFLAFLILTGRVSFAA
jgi:hypothetical protein